MPDEPVSSSLPQVVKEEPLSADPAIHDEQVRLRIKLMRLAYYKELARTIAFFLSTFKAEAVSLVSGVGTVVMGYYQLKRWVLKEKKDTKAEGLPQTGQGYGSGAGRLGAKHHVGVTPPAPKELIGSVRVDRIDAIAQTRVETFLGDPSFYTFLITGAVFSFVSGRLGMKKIKAIVDKGKSNT